MSAAWSSDHPDVLAWWEDVRKRVRAYRRECRRVEKETGRTVMLRTGFGDEVPVGLSMLSYDEEPPPGWKYGRGDRKHGFFEPRARPRRADEKRACEEASALVARLAEKQVAVRREAMDRFGVPECEFFGLSATTPGYHLLGGRLWVTFGTNDYEPPEGSEMPSYFRPERLSAYYAAREDAGDPVEREGGRRG